MAKQVKSFRLEADTVAELAKLAQEWGISQADVIQRVIRNVIQGNTESNTEGNTEPDNQIGWRELYLSEKTRADRLEERNEKLQDRMADLTDRIADSLQASQVLQAAEKEELLPPPVQTAEPEEPRLTRWQHFKAIFKN